MTAPVVDLTASGTLAAAGAPGVVEAYSHTGDLAASPALMAAGRAGLNDRGGTGTLTGSGTLWPVRPIPPLPQDLSDAELLAVELIRDCLGVRVVTELPGELDNIVPVVQITETPGGQQQVPGNDTAVIDYDAYESDRSRAKDLAAAVRACLLAGPGYRCLSGSPWLSSIEESRRPTLLAYDDASDLRRYGGAMRLHLRYATVAAP